MPTRFSARLIATTSLAGLLIFGCSKREQCIYCYDSGRVWLMSKSRGRQVFNGLGGVQLMFEIPTNCTDPESWHPTKEAVAQQLEKIEQERQPWFRPPPNYSREHYWTNLVSVREYLRKHPP
ncbi:MAG TPA: hypothetical protein VN578_09515 [Candidatus Binatia bacterium]|nr:hypothetical protein [Candidatus Binatia bacterium]